MYVGPVSSTRATCAAPPAKPHSSRNLTWATEYHPTTDSELPHRARACVLRAQSGDLFQFFLYDATNATDRSSLRAIVGEPAELLTWRFGTVARSELLNLSEAMRLDAPPPPMTGGAADLVSVSHRLEGSTTLRNADVAKVLVITIADYLEQMVETNGWWVTIRVRVRGRVRVRVG